MQVGDVVKIWMYDESAEVGLIIKMDKRTLPEKVFVRTFDDRLIEDYDENCEVISAVK